MNKTSTADIGERIAKYLCPCSYLFRAVAGLFKVFLPGSGKKAAAPKA